MVSPASSHFTLRTQFCPWQDIEAVSATLLRLVREAPVDEIMFFAFAEELNNGHETLEEIEKWLAFLRPLRLRLVEKKVLVSFNPWHTLLHTDRGRKLKADQPWQTMVDPNGKSADAVVCPLDPTWREYMKAAMRLYAKEGFYRVWIDDDIRFHAHGDLDWGGCFCPNHVDLFNRLNGTSASREEIVAKCLAAGTPHPWRELWMDMWEDAQLKMLGEWREIVASEGGTIGLMSSSIEGHAAEGRRWDRWWKTLKEKKPIPHRPHFWSYSSALGDRLPTFISRLDQNRAVQTEDVSSEPEIECFPYGEWNKSYREIGAQMALAQIFGSDALNISLFDFMGNLDAEVYRANADFLRRQRPVRDMLADLFPKTLRSSGVGVLWTPEIGRKTRLAANDADKTWRALQYPVAGWANWLGASGYSWSMNKGMSVNALSGKNAWGFSDAEIMDFLDGGRGLLLDGEAAYILTERGFGKQIGVIHGRLVTQQEVLYSMEVNVDDQAPFRETARVSINKKAYAEPLLLGTYDAAARVISEIRGPDDRRIGPGATLFANSLGGKIAIVPWQAGASVHMCAGRYAQMKKIMEWLDPTRAVGHVAGGPGLTPQFLTDGTSWRGVVWNAGPDEINAIDTRPPAAMPIPKQGFLVNGAAEITPFGFSVPRLQLPIPLRQWEFIVF